MANRTLQLLIILSRAACFTLAIVAVAVTMAVPIKHRVGASDKANYQMACALGMQAAVALCFPCLIDAERWPPGNQEIVVFTAMEWALACFTFGTACAGLAVALTCISRHVYAPTASASAMYMSVAIIACLAGLLGWFSSLATLWLVAPRASSSSLSRPSDVLHLVILTML